MEKLGPALVVDADLPAVVRRLRIAAGRAAHTAPVRLFDWPDVVVGGRRADFLVEARRVRDRSVRPVGFRRRIGGEEVDGDVFVERPVFQRRAGREPLGELAVALEADSEVARENRAARRALNRRLVVKPALVRGVDLAQIAVGVRRVPDAEDRRDRAGFVDGAERRGIDRPVRVTAGIARIAPDGQLGIVTHAVDLVVREEDQIGRGRRDRRDAAHVRDGVLVGGLGKELDRIGRRVDPQQLARRVREVARRVGEADERGRASPPEAVFRREGRDAHPLLAAKVIDVHVDRVVRRRGIFAGAIVGG